MVLGGLNLQNDRDRIEERGLEDSTASRVVIEGGPHVRDAIKPAPNKAVHLNASARIVTSAT